LFAILPKQQFNPNCENKQFRNFRCKSFVYYPPMRELVLLALKLGFTAFGGPAAHIAMLHDEAVVRRKWLTDQHFTDLLGATNLIPGPNSTEMVIHIGYLRAGWAGLIVAGVCFISPAMLMVLGLAWLYVSYGNLPQAAWLLYGIKPVVIVLIIHALWMLGRAAIKNIWFALLAAGVFLLYLAGFNEIVLLFSVAFGTLLVANAHRLRRDAASLALLPPALSVAAPAFSLAAMFLSFLKIGAILYGSGYVLFAFLRSEFVVRLAWLTDQQLIDAIAIGNVTPGPVFTAATFIGYVLGGLPGGLLATLAIFLPSFIFVGLSAPWVPRLRSSPWAASFLDGANVAVIGLMAAVTLQLGRSALVDLPTLALALVAMLLLFHYRVNSAWLVLGGAVAGLLLSLI
jgi:chromate transporter